MLQERKMNGLVSFNGEDSPCDEMVRDSIHQNNDQGPVDSKHQGRSCRSSPCYITVENEGRLEQLQIHPPDECQFTIQSPAVYINSGYTKEGEETEIAAYRNHVSNLAEINLRTETENIGDVKDGKKTDKRRRIVAKSGDTNVNLYKVTHRRKQYLKDMFTTMVEMQWRYTLLAFASSFFISWLFFAVIWYIICWAHGDFLPEHASVPLYAYSEWLESGPWSNGTSPHVPCLLATKDFTGAFLFSVETQHTIGYGSRQTTEECPEAIIFQCIQSIAGVIIQACMAGIVFAKLSRPKTRKNTVMFSRNACVTQRNGDLYLQFRVGNMRTSKLLESHVKAVFVHHNVSTYEGENIHFHQEILKVGSQMDGEEETVFLFWPIIISHKIDCDSPFYYMSKEDVIKSHFEIVVILDGIVEPTGNNMQARSSYLPNEIMWGSRFENMVTMKQGVYAVDCSQLNKMTADATPLCSAAAFDENKKLVQQRKKEDSESEEGESGTSGVPCSTNGTIGYVTSKHPRTNRKKLSFQSDLSPASSATTASSAWTRPESAGSPIIVVTTQ